MRINCNKLTYAQASLLKTNDCFILIDETNNVFDGMVYFVKIVNKFDRFGGEIVYDVDGFKIYRNGICSVINSRHIFFDNHEFRYFKMYKVLNTNVLAALLKIDNISKNINYNFFKKYMVIK